MRINIFSILTFFCAIALIGISGSEAFGQEVNLARNTGVAATQSSANVWKSEQGDKIAGPGKNAIDGNITGSHWDQTVVQTDDQSNAWFDIDLKDYYMINKIVIYPRTDCPTCIANFKSLYVIISDNEVGKANDG